jgi:hypothetical protein
MNTVRFAAMLIVVGLSWARTDAQSSNCSYADISYNPTGSVTNTCSGTGAPYVTAVPYTNTYNYTISCLTNGNSVSPPTGTLTSTNAVSLSVAGGCSSFANCAPAGPNAVGELFNPSSRVPGTNQVTLSVTNMEWVNVVGAGGVGMLFCVSGSVSTTTGGCAATACPCTDASSGYLRYPELPEDPKKLGLVRAIIHGLVHVKFDVYHGFAMVG